jgi:phosphoribosylformylglycinamidine cyclo-ligase
MYNPIKPYKHKILELIEDTWKTPYVKVERGIYPIITKKFSYLEVQHTDGIGTKGVYHWRKRSFKNAVLDALAMNLNDLAMVGAVPYALQDHITVPDDGEESVLAIMHAFAMECKKRRIAIVGGETSHHNNIEGIDISVTVSGFIKEARINKMHPGDVLIGLRSNGLHSNGFTKVRAMFGTGEWRDDFVKPTAIYLEDVLGVLAHYKVHGMMHITGGAFSKLKDVLSNADAVISQPKKLVPHKIFYELFGRGISSQEMYTTFNCGVGFVLSVPSSEAKKIMAKIKYASIIGEVVEGSGHVLITSAFDGGPVTL